MTAPRLIRLVPTGEVFDGVDLVLPEEVEPLSEEQIDKLWDEQHLTVQQRLARREMVRAVEQAHGIGRRMDA
jgi:hypothetical protein